ncbi:MAG: hypothetical protein ACYDCL_21460 [Myxococcales bacterium]
MQLTWRDPAAGIAVLLIAIMGILLVRGQVVPDQLWGSSIAIIAFLFGGHTSAGGASQVYNALNGTASAALTTAATSHAAAVAAPTPIATAAAASADQAGPTA